MITPAFLSASLGLALAITLPLTASSRERAAAPAESDEPPTITLRSACADTTQLEYGGAATAVWPGETVFLRLPVGERIAVRDAAGHTLGAVVIDRPDAVVRVDCGSIALGR